MKTALVGPIEVQIDYLINQLNVMQEQHAALRALVQSQQELLTALADKVESMQGAQNVTKD